VTVWDEVSLGDVCRDVSYGYTASATTRDTGVRFLRVTDVASGPVDWATVPFCEIDDTAVSRHRLEPGDIVIARMGTIGVSAVVTPPVPAVAASYLVRHRLDEARADPRYVGYVLKSPLFSNFIWSHGSAGGVQPNINASVLGQFAFPLPPIEEQRAISDILGALDDKIELNRQMNETLEAMVRAIFTSWFVNFDPVRARIEAGDLRLPQRPADLFPNSFDGSDLGEIPSGWGVAKLGDVISELVTGARPRGGAIAAGVPSIGAENIRGLGRYDFSKEKYIPRTFFGELQRKGAAVKPGDVLLYKDGAHVGRKTYFDRGFPHRECAVNEHVFVVRASQPDAQRYLFFWLDQDWMTNEIAALNSNSAQPGINRAAVRNLPILRPPSTVITAFDRLTGPLTDRLFANCLESQTLAQARDALLPRLLSGDVGTQPAETVIEAGPG
jgi:type I restriction enzyme S subunit